MELFQGINMENLMASFQIMGEGMFGILFVLIIIALLVQLLSKITADSQNKEDSSEK